MKYFAFCLAGFLVSAMTWAEPVVMVTDISDGVYTVVNNKQEKVLLLSRMEPGTLIRLEANAHLTVTSLTKMVEYRFVGPARLTVENDRVVTHEGKGDVKSVSLQKISAARKFSVSQRESVTQAAFEMRGSLRPGLRLDDPVDTLVVGDGLVFSWDGPRSIKGYRLQIFGSHGKPIYQTAVNTNSWVPPVDLLKEGETYEWEIEAELGKGERLTARARFNLASSELAKAVKELSPSASASFSDRVLYAIYLENNEFGYDARTIWKSLVKEHPDDMVVREHSIR